MSDPQSSERTKAQQLRTVVRPVVCPFCGSDDLELVRLVVANIYEVHCERCHTGAVIHSGDQIKL